MPYFDAAKPLLEKYNTLEYNPAKGDALLTAKGWTKDGDGMWLDENGEQVELDIISFFDFTSVGPVVVEILKRAASKSSYSEPPDIFDRLLRGRITPALCLAMAEAAASRRRPWRSTRAPRRRSPAATP